jgi:hypothetical protein
MHKGDVQLASLESLQVLYGASGVGGDFDPRKPPLVVADDVLGQPAGHGPDVAHAQLTGGAFRQGSGDLERAVGLLDHSSGLREECLALGCESHPWAVAVQQLQAQFVFQAAKQRMFAGAERQRPARA